MVNSSLKNSLARRNHKERAQPLHRQRLGLLEKHKDYVHRARDYKSKQDRIRKLREKAAFRNKDEFYWGMVKGTTKGGVATADRGNEALSTDLVKVLKTQDMGYVKVQIAKDEKQILKLRAELEITAPQAGPSSEWSAASELAEVEKLAEMGVILRPAESASAKLKEKAKLKALPVGHVLFVEERKDFESFGEEASEGVSSDQHREEAADLGWIEPVSAKRTKTAVFATEPPRSVGDTLLDEARECRLSRLTSLSAHLGRVRLLRQVEARLQATKALMGKGAARKVREAGWVEDENAAEDRNGDKRRLEGKVWKWKLERRR
ncbi:MAG: hypothetical protein TREMPRED_004150 [Tremellales sp. Tagirdzhanova-0007]|nr:MAG: hypothetical protein TREMPRED_004150 [Tremellales sp. Tagirdzhanova-0007]